MPILKVNQNGEWKDIASSYSHTHKISDIIDLPHGLADKIDALDQKVGGLSVAEQINSAVEAMASYEHPATHPASMITGLALVATSGSYKDLTDTDELATKEFVQEQIESINGSGGSGDAGSGGVSVQADWAQTDDTQADYIKNKPFGDNEDGTVTQLDNKYLSILEDNKLIADYLPDTVVTDSELDTALDNLNTGVSSWNDLTDRPFYDRVEILAKQTLEGFTKYSLISHYVGALSHNSVDFELVEGVEYTVLWDGEEYILTATKYIDNVILGNTYLMRRNEEYTAEPPFLLFVNSTGTVYRSIDITKTSHSVAIYQGSSKMLDNKYLSILEDDKIKSEYLPDVDLTGYATEDYVQQQIYAIPDVDLSNHALKTEIPTQVSALENDAGYLTEHQSLEGYATEVYVKSEIAKASISGGSDGSVENAITAADVTAMLASAGVIVPVAVENNMLLTDSNGDIYTL